MKHFAKTILQKLYLIWAFVKLFLQNAPEYVEYVSVYHYPDAPK